MYKLPGTSSHDVVYKVRRIVGIARVGHTGTLDPVACGVLPICLGVATRLADYIAAAPKTYRAEILFGVTTDSGDAEGCITNRTEASQLRLADIAAALPAFIGVIRQRPPLTSAVWIDGVRAYHHARAGREIEMPEREVTVYAFTPVRFQAGASPRLLADITCGKGTFIRSLAVDLGAILGVGASLSFLARTTVGTCRLEESITTEELADAVPAGRLDTLLRSPDSALTHLPSLELPGENPDFRRDLTYALPVDAGLYRIYHHERFLGLGQVAEGILRRTVNVMV